MALSPDALPALRGGLLALLAAALFGVSTPLVQQFGAGLGRRRKEFPSNENASDRRDEGR